MEFCSHVMMGDQPVELNEELRKEIAGINEEFASHALRVMAGAYREMPQGRDELEPADVEGSLTLAGLWGMIDPPREESIQAVSDAEPPAPGPGGGQ